MSKTMTEGLRGVASPKPVITMLSGHGCVRVQKQSIPLIERGYTVHLLSGKIPSFADQYASHGVYHTTRQLVELLSLYAPVTDVFHVHNEPSWFVTLIKEYTGKPVVCDVHDSYLARHTVEEEAKAKEENRLLLRIIVEERNNFQLADGLVFPSEPFRQLIVSEFGLTQPALTLPSYLPRSWYGYQQREWLGGLVYEGKVDLPEEVSTGVAAGCFRYCDYLELAKAARAMDMDVHLYTVRTDDTFHNLYAPHAVLHKPYDIERLIFKISRHDWGLVGNLHPTAEWDVAFPNKLFEYIAAGVPVVALNAGECSKFLEQSGCGITVKSLEELGQRWKEHETIRRHLLTTRQQWTMERHIHGLEALYDDVLARRS
jgi:glycosyltransferase involved in cell wall biosynthesis